MDFTVSHTFDVTPEHYMEIYLNPEFERYILDNSSLKKRETLSQEQVGDEIERRLKICSGVELPSVLKKTMGMNDPCYIEHARINLSTLTTDWTIEPGYFGNKVDAMGRITITPEGDTRCIREISGSIRVKMAFIGSIAEGFIVESIKKTYRETARLFEEFSSTFLA